PKVMLFDEPTSALDPEMVKEVLDTMIGLARDGMTMLCVTHEMGFARSVADRVIFMADGRIIEQAPPDQFFEAPRHEKTRSFLGQIVDHCGSGVHAYSRSGAWRAGFTHGVRRGGGPAPRSGLVPAPGNGIRSRWLRSALRAAGRGRPRR